MGHDTDDGRASAAAHAAVAAQAAGAEGEDAATPGASVASAALWAHCVDLLLVLDADGNVLDANPAWQPLLEREARTLPGAAFEALLHPEDRTRARADLTWTRERGSHHFVTRCRHGRGHYQSIAWSASSRDGIVYAV